MCDSIYTEGFAIGSVAYYVTREHSGEPMVDYGIVTEQHRGIVYLEKLEVAEFRIINGIPYNEFNTPTPWKKLPKGWSDDTKLWEETVDTALVNQVNSIRISDSKQIIKAYEEGLLILRKKATFSRIEAEFGSDFKGGKKGEYRLVKRSSIPPFTPYPPSDISIERIKCYKTYEEAKAIIDEEIKERERVAALSDYEWAVEGIDRSLNFLVAKCGMSEEDKERYREWLLSLDNVEEIETRTYTGALQWKYAKNKRWMNIHF